MSNPELEYLRDLADTTGDCNHEDIDLLEDVLDRTVDYYLLDEDERRSVNGLLDIIDPDRRIDSPESDGEGSFEGW